ncbi:MAG: hypothetical protein II767_09460 [Proteobacteria bacterium]|nr:hypothetical protein [Pseudomonadota bacterium]MBQ4360472.1 hypothetical protein [Pseudomonadota bacterium]
MTQPVFGIEAVIMALQVFWERNMVWNSVKHIRHTVTNGLCLIRGAVGATFLILKSL